MPDFLTSFITLDNIEYMVRLFLGTIVVKYIIGKYIAEKTSKGIGWFFKRYFLNTPRRIAIYLHHLNKSLNKDHNHNY